MMSDKNEPHVGRRAFGDVLQDLAGGDVEKELTRQLGDLVMACSGTKKKGKLQITINVEPGPKLTAITVNVKATVPQPSLEATQFYTDDAGALHRENPRQQKMFDGPKIVSKPEGEN